ncbi:MAG: hypothetical protein Kow0065_08710 [Methylomicrobium sp.]
MAKTQKKAIFCQEKGENSVELGGMVCFIMGQRAKGERLLPDGVAGPRQPYDLLATGNGRKRL